MARSWPIPINSDLACKNIGELLWTLLDSAATAIDEERDKRVSLQKEMEEMALQIENLKTMYGETVNARQASQAGGA